MPPRDHAKQIKHLVHLCLIDISMSFLRTRRYRHMELCPEKETVATVISCFNAFEFTKKTIESYYDSITDDTYNYVLVLVDDHSTDETERSILSEKEKYGNFCYFRYGRNMGLTQTWNDGVRFAVRELKAEYVFLVNNDVIFTREVLKRVAGQIKEFCGVGGTLTNSPGDQPLQDIRLYCKDYQPSDDPYRVQETADKLAGNRSVEIDRLNGFFMGFPRAVFEKNVYFSMLHEYFFNPVNRNVRNESGFQTRMKQEGFKSFLATDSFVFHYKDVSQKRVGDIAGSVEKGHIYRDF